MPEEPPHSQPPGGPAPAQGRAPGADPYRTVRRIVQGYALFAGLWILASDRVAGWLFPDPRALVLASSLKGLVFVLVTSALLFAALARDRRSLAGQEARDRRREEVLRASEEKFSNIFQMSPDPIDLTELETGVMLDCNPSYCRVFGYAREEVIGRSSLPGSLGVWVDPEERARHVAELKASGVVVGFETVLRRKDGTTLVAEISSATLEVQGERCNLSMVRDITAQKRAEEAERLESIGSLAGGVAHDMNNVLAAILGLASVLRSGCGDEEPQARSLDTIVRACHRGRDVVKSLLYFARRDLESEGPVSLNILVEEVVHLLDHTTPKRVRTVTRLQDPLPLVQGDGSALSHALLNLCVNAVDAMPEGGTLTLATRMDQGTVVLQVEDTGHGMTPEVARKAVEPFFTTKPVGKGTGLGLSMVYGTVKAHQGTLEIRSEPGRGTQVVLGFPALAGPLAAEAPVPAVGAPMPRSLRILLVDDDELIRTAVGPMLKALGHDVHLAEGGQEALDRLGSGLEVDLVVLDLNMPGLTGAQTLARLLELRPAQRVLLATGYSDESLEPLLAGRPWVSSLQKPFSLSEIRAKLAQIG